MIPNQTKIPFMTPFCWSITIHAVVLTSREVQNGSNTKIIRRLLYLKGKLAKIESNNEFLSPQGNTYKNEALSALTVLGIDKKKASNTIDEILKNNEISSVEELIKKTLKAV